METFGDNSIWDPNSFSQLPDEDFLALLQKQFPQSALGPTAATDFGFSVSPAAINPQSLNLTQSLPLPSLTPPSEDSSPSPPRAEDDPESPQLKRKASDDDEFEPGPSTKTQHTAPRKSSSATSTKRKSSGSGGSVDESRLMKRKEQNRAAQRAFRERKEKHVKDLEDQVAALEAKNTQAVSENENLKDLLTRLQNENMALRQASFTFSVPKVGAAPLPSQSPSSSLRTPQSLFSSPAMSPYLASNLSSPHSAFSRMPTNPLDLSSLTSFDPNMLNLLDEPALSPPQTATTAGDSMASNYGFATNGGGFLGNFRTIASNPLFTSLSTYFDEPMSAGPKPGLDLSAMAQLSNVSAMNDFANAGAQQMQEQQPPKDNTLGGVFDIDFSTLTTWPTAGDDLFSGVWGASTPYLGSTSSISPIVHQASPPTMNGANGSSSSGIGLGSSLSREFSNSSSSSSSAGASPASHNSDQSSATSMSEIDHHNSEDCPKTKGELADRIKAEGNSPFAPAPAPYPSAIAALSPQHKVMACTVNSSFPKTEKSEKNVDITTAWRAITSDPTHKAVDINTLCAEFSSKARCDGSKVVIQPEGLADIKKLMNEKNNAMVL